MLIDFDLISWCDEVWIVQLVLDGCGYSIKDPRVDLRGDLHWAGTLLGIKPMVETKMTPLN